MKTDLPERTFAFALRVVKLCKHLDEAPGVARTMSRQLLRSGTSIGANVEEGQGGQSRADFISKYSIACKELGKRSTGCGSLWQLNWFRRRESNL